MSKLTDLFLRGKKKSGTPSTKYPKRIHPGPGRSLETKVDSEYYFEDDPKDKDGNPTYYAEQEPKKRKVYDTDYYYSDDYYKNTPQTTVTKKNKASANPIMPQGKPGGGLSKLFLRKKKRNISLNNDY